ncbi:MAG: glycosyltransferase family 4 protein [Komarekiella atlantica HA4396-MV6]|jgi:glycosyltransferase involved in cell wall biosynthesis|nr:glycosyltransferase family 4 protein [Komarekiella atlantica HA4396-MV6]
MNTRKYRVLVVTANPVQYSTPLFQLMAQHPKLDILVAYCSLQGAELGFDSEFGVEIKWDIPLLDGYPWIQLSNQSPQPKLGKFFGLINLELWKQIKTGKFDAVVAYTGYAYASFWILAAAAKVSGTNLLFSTDAQDLTPRSGSVWKRYVKSLILPKIFQLANTVIVPSSGGVKFISSLGIPEQQIVLTPFVVNNEWWLAQAKQVNRAAVRQQWHIPEDSPVVLFCAKLQPWKRPQDALRAFAQADIPDSYLVFAGEGPLRSELELEAKALEVTERVRFLGFVNQSQLPSIYCTANLLVFPSEYEPFGVVVNEAMLCGCPVVVSDRVGARYDLVHEGKTGFVYPCGNLDALVQILKTTLSDRELLTQMGTAASNRMKTWSPHENVESLVQALEKAVAHKS